MARLIKRVTSCAGCGAEIDLESPPLPKYYKKGQIEIAEHSSVLLDRPKSSSAHAGFLDGIYCNVTCLVAQVKKLRRGV